MKKRNLLITLLSLILAFSVSIGLTTATTIVNAEETPVEYSMGDANLDGNVNTRDVVLIKQSIVGLTELTDKQKVFADVYADGNINTRDVVLIQQSIVGMEVDLGVHEHVFEDGICVCGYLEPHTHDYNELKFDDDNHWYECSCGAYETKENHIPGAEATETTDQKCTECDYVINPALGHVHTLHLTKVDAKQQSCTEEGNIEYYICSCNKWFTDNTATTEITDKTSVVIEKDAHKYENLKKSATEHWYECSCGAFETKEIHNPGASATETTDQKCTECDYVITPALGHVHTLHLIKVDAKAQSCTKEGNIEYYTCSCDKWFTDNTATTEITDKSSVVIAKDAHKYENLKKSATEHWYECSCGAYETKEDHKGGTATCTKKAKCSVCSIEYGEANGHEYNSVVTAPTCEEQGYTTYTCHCGDSYIDNYVDALGHTEVIDKAVAPTCTHKGLTEGKHCLVCSKVLIEQEEVNALRHNYIALKYSKTEHWYECICGDKDGTEKHDPGAEATETTEQKCTVCDYVITSALGHVHTLHLTKVDAKEQSCTATGNIEYYTCSCNKWFADSNATTEIIDKESVIIAKDGHNYTELKQSATEHWYECVCGDKSGIENHKGGTSTCIKKAICSVCEIEYGEANGHDYKREVTEPTCTEQGYTTYTCHCGDRYIADYVDALEHNFTNYISNNDATCLEDGTKTAKCNRCNEHNSVVDIGTAKGHSYSDEWSKDENYHWHSATCEHVNEVKDKQEHNWNNGVVIKPATIDEEGSKLFTCLTCGQTKEEVIPVIFTYIVNFYDGTTLLKTEKVKPTENATPPIEPEKDGFRFAGWDKTFTNVNNNLNIYAQYVQAFIVTFVDYDNSILDIQTVDAGQKAKMPSEPTRENYKFTGWDYNLNNTINQDLTIKAQYIRQYTVKFVDFDGRELKTEIVDLGANATSPTNPTRKGYTFTGWNIAYSNVQSDLVITATYEINSYTVKFVMPDNSEINEQDVEYGFDASLPVVPEYYFDWNTMKAYRFTKWDKNHTDVTSNLTIRAEYTTPYSIPVIAVEFGSNNDVSIKLCIPEGYRVYALNLSIEYDKLTIEKDSNINVNSASPLYDNYQLVYNDKSHMLTFAWADATKDNQNLYGEMLNPNGYTNFLSIVFNIDVESVNSNTVIISAVDGVVIGVDESNMQKVTPIIIYR